MINAVEIIFTIAIWGGFFCFALIPCWFASCTIIRVIQIFKPKFGVYQSPYEAQKSRSNAGVKRLAIDFLIAERIRQERLRKRQLEIDKISFSQAAPKTEWSLEEILANINFEAPTQRKSQDSARWSVALFSSGNKPWPLCRKEPAGRHLFAPLRESEWVILPNHDSAVRLAELLSRRGQDIRPVACGALARVLERQEVKSATA